MLLQANDEFMADILALRKKREETLAEVIETDDGEEVIVSYDSTDAYKNELKNLMKKYGLSHIAYFHLEHFISIGNVIDIHNYKNGNFFNHLAPRLIPKIEEPAVVQSEITGEDELLFPDNWNEEQFVAIEIFPETTINDFIRNWEDIAKERDRLYGIKNKGVERFMRSKNIERDLFIFQLKKQGMTAKNIVKELAKSEKFKGEIIGYEEVPKIIKRLKERAKRNIPHKII